jgi:hypothetical protein
MVLILKITSEKVRGHLTLHIATIDVKLDFERGPEPALFCRARCRHDTFISNVLLRQDHVLAKSAFYHRHVRPSVFYFPPFVRIAYTSPAFAGEISIKFDIG